VRCVGVSGAYQYVLLCDCPPSVAVTDQHGKAAQSHRKPGSERLMGNCMAGIASWAQGPAGGVKGTGLARYISSLITNRCIKSQRSRHTSWLPKPQVLDNQQSQQRCFNSWQSVLVTGLRCTIASLHGPHIDGETVQFVGQNGCVTATTTLTALRASKAASQL
jgi:hypothetical protein